MNLHRANIKKPPPCSHLPTLTYAARTDMNRDHGEHGTFHGTLHECWVETGSSGREYIAGRWDCSTEDDDGEHSEPCHEFVILVPEYERRDLSLLPDGTSEDFGSEWYIDHSHELDARGEHSVAPA